MDATHLTFLLPMFKTTGRRIVNNSVTAQNTKEPLKIPRQFQGQYTQSKRLEGLQHRPQYCRTQGRLREAGIRVFIVAGNHGAASQITKHLPLPDNVALISTRHPEQNRLLWKI